MISKTLLASSVGVASAGQWTLSGNGDMKVMKAGTSPHSFNMMVNSLNPDGASDIDDEDRNEMDLVGTASAQFEDLETVIECEMYPDPQTIMNARTEWGATADDSHNGALSVCELTWKETFYDAVTTEYKCCIDAERIDQIAACPYIFEAYGWDTDYMPPICEYEADDGIHSDCGGGYYEGGGVASLEVSVVTSYYHAVDWSYNPNSNAYSFTANIDDSEKPIIVVPEDIEDNCWEVEAHNFEYITVCGYEVEKCTYFDLPPVGVFDKCDDEYVQDTLSYECWGPEVDSEYALSIISDVDGSDLDGWHIDPIGKPSMDYIDYTVVGTHGCTYDAVDRGGLADQEGGRPGLSADSFSYLVVVTDNTDPSIEFEENNQVVECATEADIPDPNARCWNEPCSDEWSVHDSNLNALYSLSEDLAECADSDTFNVGWGTCETYASGGYNDGYCAIDGADALGACPVSCGTCPEEFDCADSESFDIGYGDCSTYADGEDNDGYCETDGADEECPVSCGTCADEEAEVIAAAEASDVFVDLNAVGIYEIPYSCTDGWNSVTEYQTVEVEDTTPPTIECECGCIEYYVHDCFDASDFPLQTCEEDDTCLWDHGTNDELTALPLDGDNCFDTIGTFTVTYTTYDAVGLSSSTTSDFCIHDLVDCEIELNCDNDCDPECNVDVEACTGTYTEIGATATDNYDADIQSKITTSGWKVVEATSIQGSAFEAGDEIDEDLARWTIGTYEITYRAEDQSGNSCETSRLVYVADTTPPVLEIVGDHVEIIEASVREDVGGATCTDTCTSLTATLSGTGGVGTGPNGGGDHSYGINGMVNSQGENGETYDIGPDNGDMHQFITFDIYTFNYEEMLSLNNPEVGWVDEQQYYCNGNGDAFDISDAITTMVVDGQPAEGSKADEMASQFSVLADECALREVTYSCSDWVGNTATTIQYIATIDTINPNIYYDGETNYDSYSWGSVSTYFAKTTEGHQATAAAGLAMFAVGAVAFFVTTTQRRRGYDALPVV